MDNSEEKKPLIKQGWLRVIVFIIAYLIISLLIAVPAILMLTQVNPSDLQNNFLQSIMNLATKDSLWIVALLEFVSSAICVFLFRKFVDKKTIGSLGLSSYGQANNMLAGFFLAPALVGAGSLIMYLTKHLEWDDFSFNANEFFIEVGILAFIAISEELVFRGYILNNLMQSFNKWMALLISAILFTLFHISNPGIGAIPLASLFLGGILLGMNYIYTKNLWFSIMLHFSWNLFQGPFSGYKISGVDFSSLLQIQIKGDSSITGGDFGFEGSFIATALLFFTIAALYLFYEKKYKKEVDS
ncbi:MAG TPA: CPBP family intramembrane glutamic endopeptidase [Puia sp.]|nr:CPBP family intramembrane glutamic endopeptidase [Puia sp.]